VASVQLRVELDPKGAIKGLQLVGAEVRTTGKEADALKSRMGGALSQLDDSFGRSSSKAAGFADAVGRTSTTLARSAEVFGLPIGPLRALDDAADVAELGLGNLSKAGAGFNAASLGVVGAGLAIGTMLGGLINQIPGVTAAVDKLTGSLHQLFTGVDPKAGLAGLKEWQAEIAKVAARNRELQQASVSDASIVAAVKLAEANKKLKEASALAGVPITDLAIATRILAVASDAGAAGAARHAEEMKRQAEAAAELAKGLERAELALTQASMRLADQEIAAWQRADEALAAHEAKLEAAAQAAEVAAMRQEFGLRDLNKVIPESTGLWTRYADVLQQEMENASTATDDVKNKWVEMAETVYGKAGEGLQIVDALAGAFAQLGISADHGLGEVVSGLQDMGHAVQEGAQSFASFIEGDYIGAVVHGIKALAGAVSGLKKIWDGLFGNKEIMHVNDLRDAFLDAQGGWLALQQELAKYTNEDIVKKIFDAKTVEEFNRAVQEAMDILEKGRAGGGAPAGAPSGDTGTVDTGPTPEDVPHYAMGTPWVPRTSLAVVHRGERIVPARVNRSRGSAELIGGRKVQVEYNITVPIDANPLNTAETQAQLAQLVATTIEGFAKSRNASFVNAIRDVMPQGPEG